MNARREEIKEWLYFSGEDLQSAHVLFDEGIHSQACFHAQQCVEKGLKAYAIFKSGSIKRIHDLNELLEYCYSLGAKELSVFEEPINFLSKFYTPMRYPDAAPGTLEDRLPNKTDATESIDIAEKVYSVINRIIK